jgi:menaquinol-cytochrome c reductase iron-sulfur subunit
MIEQTENSGEQPSNDPGSEAKALAHSRRAFLFKVSVILNAAVGAVLAVPLVGYLLGPATKKDSDTGSWIELGSLDSFPVGETKLINFQSPVSRLGDGDTGKVSCWVRRISAESVQVFAVNCAHLGCPVRWFAQSRLFLCPCHGGAYYEDGTRASGPPERGLFEYKVKFNGNSLLIHSGNMPTLATQARCGEKPLVQISPTSNSASIPERSDQWQA